MYNISYFNTQTQNKRIGLLHPCGCNGIQSAEFCFKFWSENLTQAQPIKLPYSSSHSYWHKDLIKSSVFNTKYFERDSLSFLQDDYLNWCKPGFVGGHGPPEYEASLSAEAGGMKATYRKSRRETDDWGLENTIKTWDSLIKAPINLFFFFSCLGQVDLISLFCNRRILTNTRCRKEISCRGTAMAGDSVCWKVYSKTSVSKTGNMMLQGKN